MGAQIGCRARRASTATEEYLPVLRRLARAAQRSQASISAPCRSTID